MKHKLSTRLISMLLVIATLVGLLAVPASAASLDNSGSVKITMNGFGNFLTKKSGGTIGGGYWQYTSNDGLKGAAYCVNWGLTGVSPSKSLTIHPYNRNPQTMGAFANGYPARTLEQFKQLHASDVRGIASLTETEYKYATQVAVWATCGQIAVPGTDFTAGRTSVVEPTSDAQKIRIYDSIKRILGHAKNWDKHLYLGMYLHAEENSNVQAVEIVNDRGLEGAAAAQENGIKKETINGREYYTRVMYLDSATSTWIDGYKTKVYSTDAPAGTMFVAANNSSLETVDEGGVTYYKVDTSRGHNTNLNANGYAYGGAFKVCIPADNVADEGSFTIRATGGVAQYKLFIAENPSATEQSYIISDPGYTTIGASATFKWKGHGEDDQASLQVTKTGPGNAPLEGAEFTLTGDKGTTVTGTSDENGLVVWKDIPADEKFTLTETKAPAGFQIVAPQNVTLTAGQTTYVTVPNNTVRGFTVKKIDAQNKSSLQGAVFRFEQIDGSYVTTGTTGFDGMISFEGDELPYGSYRVTEESPPPGYLKDTRVQTVEWTGEKDILLTFEDVREARLIIVKKDARTGVSLSGAVFDIYADGKFLTTVTTNDAGEAYVTGIKDEMYIEAREKIAPEHYVLDRSSHGIFIDPYDPKIADDPVLTITNEAKAALRIIKYDRMSGTRLSGVTFEIYKDAELFDTKTTDENGEINLYDLQPGTFLVQEVSSDDAHIVTTTPQQIELKAGQTATQELVFFNDLRPGIHLIKVDSADLSKPIANARFRLEAVDGSWGPVEMTTLEDGTIDLSKLPAGAAVVTELECPGYVIDDAQRIIELKPNETAQFVFTNSKLPSLKLTKTSSDGTPLGGVSFRLAKIEDGSRYLDRTTSSTGEIVWEGLDPGVYSLVETATVDDHIRDLKEYHVEVFPGKESTIVLENQKRPNLYVYKNDADDGSPIEHTIFIVRAADGHSVDEIETDSTGRAELKNLLPGVYEISEKSVPSPWLKDADPQLVTLYPNRDHTAYFKNHKRPIIEIIKEDSVTHAPLANVRFQVWYASNKTPTGEINDLGVFTTDENGRIELDGTKMGTLGLRDGWFRVKELAPPKGYAIKDSDTQEAFVAAGQGYTFRFENTPLSALCVWKYDSVTGEAVEGAVFQVKYLGGTSGTGGTVIGTYKTSNNGSFTVTGLKAGTYIVQELASDSGHIIDTAPQTAYISGEDQDVVQLYFGNSPKGALLVKKVDASDGAPLSDVEFFVTTSDGSVVGDANGKFVTDSAGTFTISGIEPGTTLIVKETRAKPGYLLDNTPQTAQIKAGQTVTLEFRNQKQGNLVIHKLSGADKKTPLAGVQFKITYADGRVVDAEGGKLSSNGLYWTNSEGQIILSGITGTVIVTEVQSIDGYTIDPNTRTQTVVVNPGDDTQHLWFYNMPVGGAELIKVDAADKTKRLDGVTFEIRKMDDALVDTVTTGSDGRVYINLDAGNYYALETEAKEGYKLDPTPHYFTVVDGKTASVTITNEAFSGVILHKINSVTKEGIYGVKFLVYDAGKNPIGEYTTDDRGYIYIDDLTVHGKGRLYIRELEAAPGYELDKEYKTVYVQPGKTVEIEWENTPITGQFQIRKYAAEYNEVTGTAAGAPLKGAVYEISEARSGRVVDYITTDARGVAASKPLPLGRYLIKEVTAPPYWQLSGTTFDETLEYSGQIIKLSDYDKPSNLGVTITKRGNAQVLAGSQMRYDITVANTSNVPLSEFYWHDRIPTDATRATVLTTGTYSARLNYRVLYKTNYRSGYQVLASNLLTSSNYSFSLNAIPMQAGEYVTDVYFDFGRVPVGFQSTTSPTLTVQVLGTVANNYQIINRADVGGKYQGTWQTAQAAWLTIVRRLGPVPTLPQTGY